ncbi:MAG TPA: heparinase II/III family protein, partial [Vicinamibacterales bacterium]|nr:heparinase II/III family protein [Vicinamibacterales bacterium]
AYDWLYHDLSREERAELRQGAERRALAPYLESIGRERPPSFFTARHNWNPVCNGGAAVLALAFEGESDFSNAVLERAVPVMDRYWSHLTDDGGWDEGTGYWRYGHRYAFIAAEALRRNGRPGGAERFALPGARNTGYFPLVFNPGQTLTAGFGDSNSRVADPILYLLGREYRNPDFIWFQDRAPLRPIERDGWPEDALTLLWRPAGESWLPEARPDFRPTLPPTFVFPSIGWAFMAPSQPDPPYFLSFKNGSLAANHTHLDLNHVNVGAGDKMLTVELGSRPYPADYFGPKRYSYYELTTAGHNTVLVGGKGQVHGKAGHLLGPLRGDRYEALVGVADSAYEAHASRARRHVVFVDKRYWVLLDEIRTDAPEPVELRFHTYGSVEERAPRWWTFLDAPHMLDVIPGPGVTASVESPDGWIRPVRVLRLRTTDAARDHALITVLHARRADVPPPSPVEVRQTDGEIVVMVGTDRVSFKNSAHGWEIARVSSH